MFHLSLISGYRLVAGVCNHQLYREVFSSHFYGLSLVSDGFAVLVFVMESSLDLKYSRIVCTKVPVCCTTKKADCLVFFAPYHVCL